MSEEKSYKQTIIELTQELESFRYALSNWMEELNEYKKRTAELSQVFLKLGELSNIEFREQNKIFQDLWIKLLTIATYMDNKMEKINVFIENKANVITGLLTSLNKINDVLVKAGEALEKFAEGQAKTNGLLEDVKKLLQQQLEIRKQTALESAKLKKKIEKEIGE
jgi:flagellar hook-basal body complex protein FliE